jgi:bacillithiol synthase
MNWNLHEERTGNPLTDLHEFNFTQVSDFYDGQNPRLASTYEKRADAIVGQFSQSHRAALIETLNPYMTSLGASQTSLDLLERLRDERSVAVVTGQQAGLFSGPMYTLYKAMSAVGLAKRLEQTLDRPVIPVFWVASEDHDWGEVDHAYMLDTADDVKRVKLSYSPEPHQMVYSTQLPEAAVQEVIRQAHEIIPDGPDKAQVLRWMRDAYTPNTSLATWFAKILLRLVEPHGMVVLDPCLPGLRQLVLPVWLRGLKEHESVHATLTQAYGEVEARGFTAEVVRDEANTTLFYVENGKRFVLERAANGRLRARGHGLEKTLDEWMQTAEESPTSFSSNVLLRPVVQDTLLPTVAYVGGPSEIAYHALSRGVFHAHGRTMPPLFHRDRVVLYPPSVQRNMDKWQVTGDQAMKPRRMTDAVLRTLGGADMEAELQRMQDDSRVRWADWEARYAHLGPQVGQMAMAQVQRDAATLQRLYQKTLRLLEMRHDGEVKQLRHIERWLWTDGHPQERRLCPLNIWSKYGLQWLTGLPFWGNFENPCGVYHVQI